MPSPEPAAPRVVVDGKFFRLGASKFFVKGVTYGPFAPNAEGETFPSPAQTEQDFRQIRELGANLLRVYYVPPRWLLDLAAQHELKLLVDIPWPKHLCFLDSEPRQREAREIVREAVAACRDHPAVFAYSVVNEIPADIVRWSGPAKVEAFIDLVRPYGIRELARTGVIAMPRGSSTVSAPEDDNAFPARRETLVKPPRLNPADKRLAMMVEDHPLDYGDFEGVILEGYGQGIVVLWDRGTWQPEPGWEDVDAALAKGELKFRLEGSKLKGSWVLVRTPLQSIILDGHSLLCTQLEIGKFLTQRQHTVWGFQVFVIRDQLVKGLAIAQTYSSRSGQIFPFREGFSYLLQGKRRLLKRPSRRR